MNQSINPIINSSEVVCLGRMTEDVIWFKIRTHRYSNRAICFRSIAPFFGRAPISPSATSCQRQHDTFLNFHGLHSLFGWFQTHSRVRGCFGSYLPCQSRGNHQLSLHQSVLCLGNISLFMDQSRKKPQMRRLRTDSVKVREAHRHCQDRSSKMCT